MNTVNLYVVENMNCRDKIFSLFFSQQTQKCLNKRNNQSEATTYCFV